MNAASVLVSATVAAALATLAAPARAQGTTAPAPAAKPATPPPAAKPATPPPAAKPATPPPAAKPATPPPAAKPATPAAAPAAAVPATAPAAGAAAAAPPPPAGTHASAPTAAAPAATAEPATAAVAAEPTTAAPAGTTVIMMTNTPGNYALCPPPPRLAPMFAPAAFLVRFGAGPGYTWASGDPNTTLTGASGSFDLAMGGFILQDFALHADFGWMDVFDPDFTVDGTVLDSTSVMFQASTFRAGASYYFMPIRAYLSLGVGFAVAALTSYTYGENTDNNVTLVGREYTKIGPSFAAEVGKEFAVSPYWGMGLAAHYELLSVPPGDDHAKATIDFAQQLSLRFIATFGDR